VATGPIRRFVDGCRTASAGGPSPGPSPLVPRGEGRIRSRRDGCLCVGRAPSRSSPRDLPQNCWGRYSDGPGTRRRASHCARQGPSQATVGPAPPNLPQQFWGRWARFTSPEGALRVAPEPPTTRDLPLASPSPGAVCRGRGAGGWGTLSRCRGAPGAGTPRGCQGRPGTRPSWRWSPSWSSASPPRASSCTGARPRSPRPRPAAPARP